MKFLLNMNVPRKLRRSLMTAGHECRHVGDIGLAQADDVVIIEEAKRMTEIIITHDLDYGNLLAFFGEAKPSVIIFRVRNTTPNNLFGSSSGPLSFRAEREICIAKYLLNVQVPAVKDSSLRSENDIHF